MATPELQEFFSVLRDGDSEAVQRLLCQVEPFLRRIIRQRLIDGRLRHILGASDIFQSLLKDFLSQEERDHDPERVSGGLHAYLAAAVRNKILKRVRKERRHAGGLPDGWNPVSPEPAAVRAIERQDLFEAIRVRLPEGKRRLFDLRAQGLTWDEITSEVGGHPAAQRMLLGRAVAAILAERELAESSHAQ